MTISPSRSVPATSTRDADDVQFVVPSARKHPKRSTIQHWQLRDLIACPETKKEFVYVYQNNVNGYNTETQTTTPLLKDLSFSPTSMTTGCGFLVAGGQRSQLMVKQLNTNWFAHTSVGGSINNAMYIYNHRNETRLLVSNNDETIKVYSLPGLQRITSIALPTAVNYASVSPDGRKLCVVGDSNQVFLYDVNANGSYQRVATLTASNDAGFSCAWNQSSEKFAVASQDGFVSVWDIRSSEKLVKLSTKQGNSGGGTSRSQHAPQVKGAARCVKFSPTGSIDLLLYSEHVSYVNFVDARTFNSRQTIRVAPPNCDAHISGLTFSPDSQTVFVGMENMVLEYDVDTMKRRSFPEGSII